MINQPVVWFFVLEKVRRARDFPYIPKGVDFSYIPNRVRLVEVFLERRNPFLDGALIAYRQGFQWYSPEDEEAEIVARNSGYDIQDPWETPIGDYVRSRGTTPYIRIDEVYRELDIPAAQQTTTNANRIAECMAAHGWIKARRRVGNRSTRVYAFFPDEVDKVPPVKSCRL